MTQTPVPGFPGRLTQLLSTLAEGRLDAFVVSTPLNIAYLTGFTGSSGLLFLSGHERLLITDGRYEASVRQGLAAETLGPVTLERVKERYDLTLGYLVVSRQSKRIGFEAGHVTVATLDAWRRLTPGVEWVPTERRVETQRLIKDAHEIDVYRRGGHLMARAAGNLRQIVREGRTEVEVAAGIDAALVAAGFSCPSFPTIVASGPNGALPHARPTSRRLAKGDLVVLDFGGVLDGYCLDLTRAAAVGTVSDGAMALYEAVRLAEEAALEAVRPGIDAFVIDAAARTVLEARGLGEAFLHSTGHGLGLEIHEAPRISRVDPETSDRIDVGMIFTIEPGAYVEGLGGVRLEDDVLVTAGGSEVLTDVPRELLVV